MLSITVSYPQRTKTRFLEEQKTNSCLSWHFVYNPVTVLNCLLPHSETVRVCGGEKIKVGKKSLNFPFLSLQCKITTFTSTGACLLIHLCEMYWKRPIMSDLHPGQLNFCNSVSLNQWEFWLGWKTEKFWW